MAKKKTNKKKRVSPLYRYNNGGYAYFGEQLPVGDQGTAASYDEWLANQEADQQQDPARTLATSPWMQQTLSQGEGVDWGALGMQTAKQLREGAEGIKTSRKAGMSSSASQATGQPNYASNNYQFNTDMNAPYSGGVGINPDNQGDWMSNAMENIDTPQMENPLEKKKGVDSASVKTTLGAIGNVASAVGGAIGQGAHSLITAGLPFLNSMLKDNARPKRPIQPYAVNPNAYGTGSSALANYGTSMQHPYQANQGMVMPIATGDLQVEGNQYSFLSPETISVGGKSHENGGTMVQYGGNTVEAEAGEPMSIGQDGQAIVWGNMYVPGTRTKFKGVAKKIAKEEKKTTHMLGRATKLLNDSNPKTSPFEALSFNSGKVLNEAASARQDAISGHKSALAELQQAMLDYSEATGIKPDKLSKNMKKGGKMPLPKYAPGGTLPPSTFPGGVWERDVSRGRMQAMEEVPNNLGYGNTPYTGMPPTPPTVAPYELPGVEFRAQRPSAGPVLPLGGGQIPVPSRGIIPTPGGGGGYGQQRLPRIPLEGMNQIPTNFSRPVPQARNVPSATIEPYVQFDTYTDDKGKQYLMPKFSKIFPEAKKKKYLKMRGLKLGDREILTGDAYNIAQETMQKREFGGCMECGGEMADNGTTINISNRDEYNRRAQMYNDSLAFYNYGRKNAQEMRSSDFDDWQESVANQESNPEWKRLRGIANKYPTEFLPSGKVHRDFRDAFDRSAIMSLWMGTDENTMAGNAVQWTPPRVKPVYAPTPIKTAPRPTPVKKKTVQKAKAQEIIPENPGGRVLHIDDNTGRIIRTENQTGYEYGGNVIAGQEYGIASYPMFPPENDPEAPLAESGFQLNPAHEGWCTPMSKSTCTGKRRQFAINAKNHFKKQEFGGMIGNVGDEVDLSPDELEYYRSMGYEFE